MADGDILDFISNNWGKLLGLGPGSAGGMTDPMSGAAMNGPVPGTGTGAPFSPNSAPNGGTLNPAIANAPWIGSAPATGPNGVPMTPPPAGPGGSYTDPMSGAVMPPPGPPSISPPGAPGGPMAANAATSDPMSGAPMKGVNVPLPSAYPAPPGQGYGGGPVPPQIATDTGPTPGAPPPGPPLPITPQQQQQAPPTQTAGDFLRALGIQRVSPGERALTAGLTGLGHGLTAVGNLRPGAPAAQAFAAGAGGALTGGMKSLDDQKRELFNQSSTAFRDMILARTTDNQEMYRNAQAQWLLARAKQQMVNGGSKAMLNTPEGKVAYIENETLRMRDQYRKSAEARAKAAGEPLDEADVDKRADAYRRGLYRQFKLDPDEGKKMLDRGMSPENAFPNMSVGEFHLRVPKGAYYDSGEKYDKNGTFTLPSGAVMKGKPGDPVILIRTTDPPGEAPAAAAAPAAPGSSALEDYYAMNGSA